MNALTRLVLRLPALDTSGAFRIYRVAKLQDLDLAAVRSTGYAYLEEILWHLDDVNAQFAEVPITFRQRRTGRSKIGFRTALDKLDALRRISMARLSEGRRTSSP